eukprot:Ihof_evm9s65 gene=Ihof_evmTU9s65
MAIDQQEVEELRKRGDEVTDESLAATRRIRQYAEESNQVGANTMNTLHAQGEQLDNVERDLDKINADMRKAEGEMQNMEKCCGLCVMPWKKTKKFETSNKYKKAYTTTEQPLATDIPGEGEERGDQGPAKMKRITNDAREDEMEENLDAVGGILNSLKGQ